MRPVLNKTDMVRRYIAGEFGNASPSWPTVGDFLRSGWDQGLVHLRNREKSGYTLFDVPPEGVENGVRIMTNNGVHPSSIYVSALCPNEKAILVGEVQEAEPHRDTCGLELYYATVPGTVRHGLATAPKQAHGLQAKEILNQYLCPNSLDWLEYLLREYPGHVVEISTLSLRWGTLYPRFNTIFWEVRKY